jgi:hypothetical protein
MKLSSVASGTDAGHGCPGAHRSAASQKTRHGDTRKGQTAGGRNSRSCTPWGAWTGDGATKGADGASRSSGAIAMAGKVLEHVEAQWQASGTESPCACTQQS